MISFAVGMFKRRHFSAQLGTAAKVRCEVFAGCTRVARPPYSNLLSQPLHPSYVVLKTSENNNWTQHETTAEVQQQQEEQAPEKVHARHLSQFLQLTCLHV